MHSNFSRIVVLLCLMLCQNPYFLASKINFHFSLNNSYKKVHQEYCVIVKYLLSQEKKNYKIAIVLLVMFNYNI